MYCVSAAQRELQYNWLTPSPRECTQDNDNPRLINAFFPQASTSSFVSSPSRRITTGLPCLSTPDPKLTSLSAASDTTKSGDSSPPPRFPRNPERPTLAPQSTQDTKDANAFQDIRDTQWGEGLSPYYKIAMPLDTAYPSRKVTTGLVIPRKSSSQSNDEPRVPTVLPCPDAFQTKNI